MTEAAKKNSKAGFYFVMALLVLCVGAYAGLPIYLKMTGHKAPESAMEQAASAP